MNSFYMIFYAKLVLVPGRYIVCHIPRMNCLFLDSLNTELFKFLVENLTKIHDHRLMDLLPKMSAEDLNQRYLQGGDFSVEEDTSQIKLNLETNVDICAVYSGRPP
jgi:hypothetical protein